MEFNKNIWLALVLSLLLVVNAKAQTISTVFDNFDDAAINPALWDTSVFTDPYRKANVITDNDFFSNTTRYGYFNYEMTETASGRFRVLVGGVTVYTSTTNGENGYLELFWYPQSQVMKVFKNSAYTSVVDLSARTSLKIEFNQSQGYNAPPASAVSEGAGVLKLSTNDGGLGDAWTYLDNVSYSDTYINYSLTYNLATFPGSIEPFKANATFNSSEYPTSAGILVYNGVSYPGTKVGTGDNALFLRNVTIPDLSGLTPFYWIFNLTNASGQSSYFNTSFNNQTVNPTILSFCNATYNVPYVNFTFKDEELNTNINGTLDNSNWNYSYNGVTKTFTYANINLSNPSYSFCFSPSYLPYSTIIDLQYSFTGYPQRRYYSSTILTNTTTNQALYLLTSANGIYSSFQVIDGTGNQLPGATVLIQRQIAGTWITIGLENTDASGLVTFWVNPNYQHTITASKLGYPTVSASVRPTQSTYTIALGGGGSDAGVYKYKGITYNTYPTSGALLPNQTYAFGVYFNSSLGDITSCKIIIRNVTFGDVASATGCTAYGGNISVNVNTSNYEKLFGTIFIDIGNGYEIVKSNDAWYMESIETSEYNWAGQFWQFMTESKDWEDFGATHNRQEFSRVTFFFICLVIGLGLFCYFTGFDLSNPGMTVILLWLIVGIFSIAGWFEVSGIVYGSFMRKYVVFLMTTFLCWGFMFHYLRRNAT